MIDTTSPTLGVLASAELDCNSLKLCTVCSSVLVDLISMFQLPAQVNVQ